MVTSQDRIRELEAKVDALEEFTAVLAHDLQAPARRMASFADLLTREYGRHLPEPGVEYLAYIAGSARRLRDLVAALLIYAESGASGVETTMVDTDAVLAGVLADLEAPLREAAAVLDVSRLPRVVGTAPIVGFVLQALIERALSARGETPPRLKIRAAPAESNKSVDISVEDDGMSIERDGADQVFAPFRRMSNPMDPHPGTGLALASAQRLVEAVGGSLTLDPAGAGPGSRFVLRLPAAGTS